MEGRSKKREGKICPFRPLCAVLLLCVYDLTILFFSFSDDSLESGVAHFSGHSWISLPTLTHAYSDLQLSFEFKPEAEDGILLLTGETRDMTGDYLALLLREGHVELRYCSILVFTLY